MPNSTLEEGMTSPEVYDLVRIGLMTCSGDRVTSALEADERGSRNLTAGHCFQVLEEAISIYKNISISHQLLNYAENVYEEKLLEIHMEKSTMLRNAVMKDMHGLINRLALRCPPGETLSCQVLDLILKPIRDRSCDYRRDCLQDKKESEYADAVRCALDNDEQGEKNLTAQHFFATLYYAITCGHEEITHVMLDHAENVYDSEIFRRETEGCSLLLEAYDKDMLSIVERLTGRASVDEVTSLKVICPIIKEVKQRYANKLKEFDSETDQSPLTTSNTTAADHSDLVQTVLETDENGARCLKAGHCFYALDLAINHDDKQTSHLLLNYAQTVFEETAIRHQIRNWNLLLRAVWANDAHLLQKLVEMVPADDVLLCAAVQCGGAEVIEVLIAAGCSPHRVLRDCGYIFERRLHDNEQDRWRVLLPHWTAEEVLQSALLSTAIKHKIYYMPQLLEDLGMDFATYMSGSAVTKCVELALKHHNLRVVLFFVERGLDADTCIGSKLLLHHLFDEYRRDTLEAHNALVGVLMRCANPLLEDSRNENVIDVCLGLICHQDVQGTPNSQFIIMKLLVHIGYRIPLSKLSSMPTCGWSVIDEVTNENCSLPSLQNFCRQEIRLMLGGRKAELISQLQYPQNLKDFLLFKDIDFDEFALSEEEVSSLPSPLPLNPES